MHVIRSAETGEITTSVDFETIKEQLIEEYTDMIEAIGVVEFITAHEKAIAEAKGEEFNHNSVMIAIVEERTYPLILNLSEYEKPLLMKVKYNVSTDKNNETTCNLNKIIIEDIGDK